MGKPALELLQKMNDDAEQLVPHSEGAKWDKARAEMRRDKMLILLANIIPQINPDTCLNENQVVALQEDLEHAARSPREVIPEMSHRLITLINSYRFDCENCLNEDCEMRDPDVPLERVVASAKNEEVAMTSNVHDFLEGRVGVESLSIEFEPFFSDNSEDVGRHLDFSVRTSNLLRENGIFTFGDLKNWTRADLKAIKGLGRKSLKDIEEVLSALGVTLKRKRG